MSQLPLANSDPDFGSGVRAGPVRLAGERRAILAEPGEGSDTILQPQAAVWYLRAVPTHGTAVCRSGS